MVDFTKRFFLLVRIKLFVGRSYSFKTSWQVYKAIQIKTNHKVLINAILHTLDSKNSRQDLTLYETTRSLKIVNKSCFHLFTKI